MTTRAHRGHFSAPAPAPASSLPPRTTSTEEAPRLQLCLLHSVNYAVRAISYVLRIYTLFLVCDLAIRSAMLAYTCLSAILQSKRDPAPPIALFAGPLLILGLLFFCWKLRAVGREGATKSQRLKRATSLVFTASFVLFMASTVLCLYELTSSTTVDSPIQSDDVRGIVVLTAIAVTNCFVLHLVGS